MKYFLEQSNFSLILRTAKMFIVLFHLASYASGNKFITTILPFGLVIRLKTLIRQP